MLLQMVHSNPMANNLGKADLMAWFLAQAFMVMWADVLHECQLLNPRSSHMGHCTHYHRWRSWFKRIDMDLIWPLMQSPQGYPFVFILVDCATRHPKAGTLCRIYKVLSFPGWRYCTRVIKQVSITHKQMGWRNAFIQLRKQWFFR